jgi:hypothetical protein
MCRPPNEHGLVAQPVHEIPSRVTKQIAEFGTDLVSKWAKTTKPPLMSYIGIAFDDFEGSLGVLEPLKRLRVPSLIESLQGKLGCDTHKIFVRHVATSLCQILLMEKAQDTIRTMTPCTPCQCRPSRTPTASRPFSRLHHHDHVVQLVGFFSALPYHQFCPLVILLHGPIMYTVRI